MAAPSRVGRAQCATAGLRPWCAADTRGAVEVMRRRACSPAAPPARTRNRAARRPSRAARYAAGGGKRVRVGSPLPGFQNPFFPISFYNYIVRRFTTG